MWMDLCVYDLKCFRKKKRDISHFAGKLILIKIVWFCLNYIFQKQSLRVVGFMIHKNQRARNDVLLNMFRL